MVSHNAPSAHDFELLSAYLDGELTNRERITLEQRLAYDPGLQQMLDDLRATVTLLHDLPRLQAPRDFTLDPAVYGRAIPWWQRWFALDFTLQFAGALGAAASVILVAVALVLSSPANRDNENKANQADLAAETGQNIALLPTATVEEIPGTARTAIAYDGEGLLQNTIEAQTYHYATNEALTLTSPAVFWDMTATPPLPVAGLVEGDAAGGGMGNADGEMDFGADADNALGANAADNDDLDTIADADAAAPMPPDNAPDDAGEGAVGFAAATPSPPMPPIAEANGVDPGVLAAAPGGDTDDADGPASPQDPMMGTMLPPPTQAPAADQVTGTAKPTAADDAANAGEPAVQAEREHDNGGAAGAPTTAAPLDGEHDEMTAAIATPTLTAVPLTVTPSAFEPGAVAAEAMVPTEQPQDFVAEPTGAEQPSGHMETKTQADDNKAEAWMLGLGGLLFIVSIVIFIVGRRKAAHQ